MTRDQADGRGAGVQYTQGAADEGLTVVSVGPSGCGKTQILYDLFIRHIPRRFSADFNREVRDKLNPQAITTYTPDEAIDALEYIATQGATEWHVTYSGPYDSVPELSPRLAAILNPPRLSDEHIPFPVAMGGMSFDCSEAKYWVPNNGPAWAKLNGAYTERGRHNRLQVFLATQYPRAIPRSVTESAHHVFAFGTTEAASQAYWAENFTRGVAQLVKGLPRFHAAWIYKAEQRIYVLDEHRDCYRITDYDGADVDAPVPQPA